MSHKCEFLSFRPGQFICLSWAGLSWGKRLDFLPLSASYASIKHPSLCTCSWVCLCVGCSPSSWFPSLTQLRHHFLGKLHFSVLCWPRRPSALAWHLVEAAFWFRFLWAVIVPCEGVVLGHPGHAPSGVFCDLHLWSLNPDCIRIAWKVLKTISESLEILT